MFDWYRLASNRLALVGAAIVALVLVSGLLAPVIAPDDPIKITPHALAPPSGRHPFGTDDLGRDVLSRVLYGARISPLVGLLAVAISALAGVTMGLASGYAGGLVDNVIMRIVDVLLSFPGIVLAIGIVAILGPEQRTPGSGYRRHPHLRPRRPWLSARREGEAVRRCR